MNELLDYFNELSTKEMTEAFNDLPVKERKAFLNALSDENKKEFVTKLRNQAVADFWTNEKKLIKEGRCTRDWTPEQIEDIMKISEKTGKESINGAIAHDLNGKAFYGHHMLDVSTHPEYAGDWRNIQALDYDEHYKGAHNNHKTQEPTKGYYDVNTKETIVIDIPEGGVDFDSLGYPPKTTCIFKSNEEIKTLYQTNEKVTDGELLALKNLELATTSNGGLDDFERCLDVAERYQCSDFEVKYGIMSEFDISNKYVFWKNITYKDKLAFRAYEYYKDIGVDESCIEKLGIPSDTTLMQKYNFVDIGDSGLDMLRAYEYQYRYYVDIPDTKVYFDDNGNIIGLSHFDSSISEKSTYEILLSDAANYQSDGDMLFKYADYNIYSELDKIKASQYEYERRVIASMMKEGIVGKDGITLTSWESLKNEYNLTEDIISADVLTELQVIEYREAKYGMNAVEDSFARVLSAGNQELISFFLNHSDTNTMNAVMEKVLEKSYVSATNNFFEQYKKADLVIDLSKGELCSNFNDKVMNAILSNTQIEQLNGVSKTDLTSLYRTVALTDVIDVLKVTGNATEQEYTYYNCYDGEGKLLGVEIYVEGTDYALKTVTGDIAYKGLTSDIVDFASDNIMEEKFGSDRYQVLTATEKLELKEFDKVVRDLTVIGDHAYASNVVESYMLAANKSADSLNEIDKALIGLANELQNHGSQEITNARIVKYIASAENVNKIVKKVGKAGTVLDIACNTIELGFKLYEVNEALQEGEKDKAAGIVVGAAAEFAISTVGGTALTELIAPYLVGFGSATLGPTGAVIGGILSGVIGYGAAGSVGSVAGDGIINIFDELDEDYTWASNDPLAIDFDGDGFELLSLENGVYFDEDGSGLKEKTQWVSSDDALLAFDVNGDGVINDGSELLGTSTRLKDGAYAESGFEALAQYDSNQDGMIDENDNAFSKLVVWQDKNSDGISQENEIYTMNALGVESISLKYENKNGSNVADFTYAGGKTIQIGEFDFIAKLYDSMEKEEIRISEDILQLPNIRPIGNVASLHTMMEQDETGVLKELVRSFVAVESSEERKQLVTDILYFVTGAKDVDSDSRGSRFDAQKLSVIEEFLGRDFQGIMGCNPYTVQASILEGIYEQIYDTYYNVLDVETSLLNYLDMVHWVTDEKGRKYLDTSMFDSFVNLCRENDIDMSKEVVAMGRYIVYMNANNQDNVKNYVANYLGEKDYFLALSECEDMRITSGTDDDDTFSGSDKNNIFVVGAGNDQVKAEKGEDVLYGEAGNDMLDGGAGDDILIGGSGSDTLKGGEGNDTYELNVGDGKDIIDDSKSNNAEGNGDKIIFGEGIQEKDVKLSRDGYDLVIRYSEDDEVKIQAAYYGDAGEHFIENISFADGTEWNVEEIMNHLKVREGTEERDKMSGYGSAIGCDQNEIFYAAGGDDEISAGYGDDILVGGRGNDTLKGESGNDIYIFNLGDGEDIIKESVNSSTEESEDKIVFGEGIKEEDVKLLREDNHMIIRYSEVDKVKLENVYFGNRGDGLIESVSFSDGTEWNMEDLMKRLSVREGTEADDVMNGYNSAIGYEQNEIFYGGAGNDQVKAEKGEDVLYGEAGNDMLEGGAGDDILIGGSGSDTLKGGEGNDTYELNVGDGKDIIDDSKSNNAEGNGDKIIFGEGIQEKDVKLSRDGYDLVIRYSEDDEVKIQAAYYGDAGEHFIENISFADGTEWNVEEIMNHLKVREGTEERDKMSGYGSAIGCDQNEIFYAAGGDDEISAGYGDDILVGGRGNDTLKGESGNDIYIFNLGDGEDIIKESVNSSTEESEDKIVFGEGIKEEDVKLLREDNHMIIRYSEVDKVKLENVYLENRGDGFIESVSFSDGTEWNMEELMKRLSVREGTEADDVMNGYNSAIGYEQNEIFYCGAGNDQVKAEKGEDVLYGEAGNDMLDGGAGDDMLVGGSGNDILIGGLGVDTYHIGADDGNDIIKNNDSSTDCVYDKIVYGQGIYVDDVVLTRKGNDLLITNSKTEQVTTVSSAYCSDEYKLYNLEFHDQSTAIIDYITTTMEITRVEVKETTINNMNNLEEQEADSEDIKVSEPEEQTIDTENACINESEESEQVKQVVDEEDIVREDNKEAREDIVASESVETITKDDETAISTDSDMEDMITHAVQVIEDVEAQDLGIVIDESVADTEETDANIYVDVRDSDIDKMANLIVQEMVEPSSHSVVQESSVTEVNKETVDIQLWSE